MEGTSDDKKFWCIKVLRVLIRRGWRMDLLIRRYFHTCTGLSTSCHKRGIAFFSLYFLDLRESFFNEKAWESDSLCNGQAFRLARPGPSAGAIDRRPEIFMSFECCCATTYRSRGNLWWWKGESSFSPGFSESWDLLRWVSVWTFSFLSSRHVPSITLVLSYSFWILPFSFFYSLAPSLVIFQICLSNIFRIRTNRNPILGRICEIAALPRRVYIFSRLTGNFPWSPIFIIKGPNRYLAHMFCHWTPSQSTISNSFTAKARNMAFSV
jgi:hypothetical protein